MIDFLNIAGGKGGQEVGVENPNPEGDLSFAHALSRTDIPPGPRTIIFKTSGNIPSPPSIGRSNLTIAGATSPGGVCLYTPQDKMGDCWNMWLGRSFNIKSWEVYNEV